MLLKFKLSFPVAATICSMMLFGVMTDAEARPSTKPFTCFKLKQFIRSHGSVVMNTKNQNVYRKFVAHGGFCLRGEGIEYYSAPVKDGKCRVKICVEIDYDDWLWRQ